MRWVDFGALRDLLALAEEHPLGLRARDLTRLASEEHILERGGGEPLSATTHYHYRRTLERLQLLEKRGRLYFLNAALPEARTLTARRRLNEPLDSAEKVAFASVVLRNEDCQRVFFDGFLEPGVRAGSLDEFVERAQPLELSVRRVESIDEQGNGSPVRASADTAHSAIAVAMRPQSATRWRVIQGTNAVQAIHFGLRPWCVDQMGFLDFAFAPNGVYTMYPVHIRPRVADDDLAIAMLNELHFDRCWATIRIVDCALATGIQHRVPIARSKAVFKSWLTDHPDLVAGIPTREGFVTHGVAERQQRLVLQGYLPDANGAYLSHLRIHEGLKGRVGRG